MRNSWAKHIAVQSRIPAVRKKSILTLIFNRARLALLAFTGLAACDAGTGLSFAAGGGSRVATQEIRLEDGLRVRAPFGKCVDVARTRQAGGAATVLMANCSNLGGRPDMGARDAALLLVTVAPGLHGNISALSSSLRATPGLLARSGDAADIEIVQIKTSRRALYTNVVDHSSGGPEGTSAQHWKAALDVAGRAVVISVFGKSDSPLEGGAGERLARDTAQALIDANAETSAPAERVPTDPPAAEPRDEAAPQGGFFSRLLGAG